MNIVAGKLIKWHVTKSNIQLTTVGIGIARIFSGGALFLEKVDDFFLVVTLKHRLKLLN